MNIQKLLLLTFSLIMLVSCGQQEATEDDLSLAAEAAITALGGTSDEQSGASYSLNRNPQTFEKLINLLSPSPQLYAQSSCGQRAVQQVCDSGVKRADYLECDLPNSNRSLDGYVSLSYSALDCSLDEMGESVTRTFSIEKSGSFGSVSISSDVHQDYRGNDIGGGSQLSLNADGTYSLSILGKRKQRTRANGEQGFDISIRTISDLIVSGGLARANRNINSGQIELIHNRLEYVATLTPQNLQYSMDCCYPVSGSLNLEYSGSLEGSANIVFNGCGDASITYNELELDINFYSCE